MFKLFSKDCQFEYVVIVFIHTYDLCLENLPEMWPSPLQPETVHEIWLDSAIIDNKIDKSKAYLLWFWQTNTLMKYTTLVKSVYQKYIFIISQPKHML